MKAKNVKLTKTDAVVTGDKRQGAPYKLEWTCPECGDEKEYNYAYDAGGGYYLLDPQMPGINRENLYCDECDFEESIYFKVDMTMEIVDGPESD